MANLVDVVAIAADFGHGLALTKDNIVWGWGQNDYGQLGDGTTDDQSKPMQVAELSGVTAIAAGFGHSLALKGYGSVWAWGANSSGQLGDNTLIDRHTRCGGYSGESWADRQDRRGRYVKTRVSGKPTQDTVER